MKGKLIAFEGIEGAGTTVQVERLKTRFEQQGKKVMVVREPGGTEIGEQIRNVVLGLENRQMTLETELLLFMAARAQVYSQVILPELEKGRVVLCDRSRDSSVVYQGMARKLGWRWVEKLNDWVCQKIKPDFVILLDVPVKVGLKRRQEAGVENRMDKQNQGFYKKVRKAYLKWAKKNKKRWVIIDGTKSQEEVGEKVWLQMKKLI